MSAEPEETGQIDDPERPTTPDESARLDQAIAEYLHAQDRGAPLLEADWLARYPDVRPRLVRFLANQELARNFFASAPEIEGGIDEEPPTSARIRYFGDFELVRVLGQGGMGVVYLAHQISLDRPVALKMIRSGQLADDDEVRRFRNESEAVARLDHPHLLTIFEVGEHEGRRYFTMPLVGGGSLADQIGGFRADPARVARIVAAVADGIDHAHRRGILHRDLKPANVLIDETDRPLVSDFGLSKRLDNGESSTGAILGTPAYMSPEQALGRNGATTTSSDIYGLGAILYALLTGRAPFGGSSALEVLRRVAYEDPEDPARLNRRVDRRLAAVCLRCLDKDPRRRYPTAGALAEDLRRWGRGEPVHARPARLPARVVLWCRRHPIPATLAGLLAFAVVVGAAGIAWSWGEAEHQRRILNVTDRYFRVALLGQDAAYDFSHRVPTVDVRGLDYAESRIGDTFRGLPEAEARVRESLGKAYRGIGRPDKARPQLERALALLEATGRPDATTTQLLRRELASLLIASEAGPRGRQLADGLPAEPASLGSGFDRDTLLARATQAQGLLAAGQPAEAAAILREVLGRLDPDNDRDGQFQVACRGDLALALKAAGHLDQAEAEFQACIRLIQERTLADGHPLARNARNAYAAFLIERERGREAGPLLVRAMQGMPAEQPGDSDGDLVILANYAALRLQGATRPDEEARRLADRAVRGMERMRPSGDTQLRNTRMILADALMLEGAWADALEQYRRLVRDRQPGATITPTEEVYQASRRAEALVELGRPDEARDILGSVLRAERDRLLAAESARPPDTTAAAASRKRLGQILTARGAAWLALGYFEGAVVDLLEARDLRAAPRTPGDRRLAWTESLLGEALAGRGRADEAEVLLLRGYRILQASDAPKRLGVRARRRLRDFYLSRGRADEAAQYATLLD